MASREARRRLERKAEQKSVQEKRLERHPAIFAISFVILVVVIISFIFYGVSGKMGGSAYGTLSFGKYGNKEISYLRSQNGIALNYFTSKIDSYQPEFENAQGDQAKYYWRQAFDDTGFHYSLMELAQASGYAVSKDMIVDNLQNSQLFRNEKGEFDEQRFLDSSTLERTQLQAVLEEQLIHQQFLDDLFFGQNTSSKEIEFYKSMASRERRFNYVSFKYDDFPESKIGDYAKSNPEKFKKMKLSRIFLTDKTQKEAEDIMNMYNKKEKSFEDLAKTYSKDIYATNGGDMGTQYFHQVNVFVESLESVRSIFALARKDDVTLVKNGDNWEIYRCNEPATDADLKDPTTITDIRNYMKSSERATIEDYANGLAKSFKDKAASTSFADAAREIKQYPVYETEFFPINYRGFLSKTITVKGSGPSLESATSNKQFFQDAFTLSKDAISNPISLTDQVVVLKLIEEKTLSAEDWKAVDGAFSASFSAYQFDPIGQKYFQKLYSIAKQSDMSQNFFLFQYLRSMILSRADELGIPYQYAMDTVFFRYDSLTEVLAKLAAKSLEDKFDDGYKKMVSGGGV